MDKSYIRKFRGCPSLTPKTKADLVEALSTGAPIEIACEAAGIVKDTFYRWMRAGKALHLGEESPDIPHFLNRQPDESDDVWSERQYLFDWTCAHLEDIFLTVMKTIARKRVEWMRRMDQRALNDKEMYANAWVLERTVPQHFALVTTSRREVDFKAEITHKNEVEAFAELYALLGHRHQQALPAGAQTIELPEGNAGVRSDDHD